MQHSLIAEILAKVHTNDLPALSEHANEIRSLTQNQHATTASLVSVFMKDFALACRILRTANSPYYKRPAPLASVSIAVNSLGHEDLKTLATNTMVLEEYVKAGMEQDLALETITLSLVSATLAKQICTEAKIPINPEEAFISTMLRDLGKVTVLLYFPESYHEISQMIARGASETDAAWVALRGMTLSRLGMEIARSWHFPEHVVQAINDKKLKIEQAGSEAYYHNNLAAFCNEFVLAVRRNQNANKILGDYRDLLKLDKEEALHCLNKSLESTKNASDTYRLALRNIQIQSAVNLLLKTASSGSIKISRDMLPAKNGRPRDKADHQLPDTTFIDTPYDLQPDSLNDYLYLFRKGCFKKFDLKQSLIMLLTGMHRGLQADRVIIMQLVAGQEKGKILTGGLGLGEYPAGKLVVFDENPAESRHVVIQSLKDGKDRIFASEQTADQFPRNLASLVKGRKCYFMPLMTEKRPVGLIYLDIKGDRKPLSKNQFEGLQFCRDLMVQAIHKDKRTFTNLITLKT
ncbi:MAG: HDOD domain-containing protein [Proteobacteria bacterium]|nr:HDOD domain-containing protein [Pseudomonadota bacterium]MBU1709060.1 HDOD domain-containing protein [Pseudomonadota bacterium]